MSLGDGDYQILVCDQGGKTPIGELQRIASMTLTMVRDDTGFLALTISKPDADCCQMVAELRTGRHEIAVFRNGYRVWEGPITRIGFLGEKIEIDARDITWYMSRRALEFGFDHTGVSYPALLAVYDLLTQHYPATGDRFNIGPFLTMITSANDPNTAAVYKPYSQTVFNVLENYATRGGLDYTVTGRRLIVYGTRTKAHVLPKMTDEHLSDSVHMTEYGNELMTRIITTNSEDSSVITAAPQHVLDYYGPIDLVNNNTDEGDGEPDEEELEDISQQAQNELDNGWPAPVRLWVPDGSRLDPCYPAEFTDLVPGAWVPLEAHALCRDFAQWQKLQQVKIDWGTDGEKVQVTLVKATNVVEAVVSTVSPTL